MKTNYLYACVKIQNMTGRTLLTGGSAHRKT